MAAASKASTTALHLLFALSLAAAYFLARDVYSWTLATHPAETLRLLLAVETPVVIGVYSSIRRDPGSCSYYKAAGRGIVGLPVGRYLSMLPVDPKLGKMLIMGVVFRCLDPILTVVSGLSVRDPFLLPQEKKDLAGTAKARFSAKDYSDHMALVRAYEGWKDADREGSAYEYCCRNFLSAQTLQAIHSLRKQFSFILKDAGLLDADPGTCNSLSRNQSVVRAVICSGLFPGITSVVHREKTMSFKTMDDGPVHLYTGGGLERSTTTSS